MIRRLLWLLAAIGLAYWLDRLFRRSRPRSVAPASGAPRFEGAMVRDRVCQTFLPRSRALHLRLGGAEHFFCSESCRDAFLARSRSGAA